MSSGYKCILAIVNNGFSEEAMEAAKACGARGGTILHGRGTISKEAENKYVGVSCGKLDQSCEVFSKKDKLLYLDTKDESEINELEQLKQDLENKDINIESNS